EGAESVRRAGPCAPDERRELGRALTRRASAQALQAELEPGPTIPSVVAAPRGDDRVPRARTHDLGAGVLASLGRHEAEPEDGFTGAPIEHDDPVRVWLLLVVDVHQ